MAVDGYDECSGSEWSVRGPSVSGASGDGEPSVGVTGDEYEDNGRPTSGTIAGQYRPADVNQMRVVDKLAEDAAQSDSLKNWRERADQKLGRAIAAPVSK